MRKYLIVTVLLSAVLMGLMLFCAKSFTQMDAVQAEMQSQSQQIENKKEQFNLRIQQLTGQLANTAQIRKVRREIAKINTLITERKKNS